jgi:hypothetical protein
MADALGDGFAVALETAASVTRAVARGSADRGVQAVSARTKQNRRTRWIAARTPVSGQ